MEQIPADSLATGRFDGREAFRQLVRDALHQAAAEGWPELLLCDADFADWPLGERAVVESLQAWAGGRRRLVLLAGHYDAVLRLHPRFVQWRVRWEHLVTARKARAAQAQDLPSLCWTRAWAMHRIDPVRSQGVATREPERLVLLREQLDEWLLNRSTPGFASSVLGL
ncbi:hypothetical protein [Comamonas flocculans]|uniref:Uncharacterized protein n=1 Tax=Comamonas flocculans TaxID=2597701 RepID=A0A5B8RSU1_9BURK|nr:hypothetical protein [Comamonas flocculans]QEA11794.1 hypothetical protein FOZ74_01380 [Comamonas flocculans]